MEIITRSWQNSFASIPEAIRARPSDLAKDLDRSFSMSLVNCNGYNVEVLRKKPVTYTYQKKPFAIVNGEYGYQPFVDFEYQPYFMSAEAPVDNADGFSIVISFTGLYYLSAPFMVSIGEGGVRGLGISFQQLTYNADGDAPLGYMYVTNYGVVDAQWSNEITDIYPSRQNVNLVIAMRTNGEKFYAINGIVYDSIASPANYYPWDTSLDRLNVGYCFSFGDPPAFRGIYRMAAAIGYPIDRNTARDISLNPAILFASPKRRIFYSLPAVTPILSAATVTNITTTTVRPRVTITFP
jgi:hypothetical protein